MKYTLLITASVFSNRYELSVWLAVGWWNELIRHSSRI